MDDTLLFIPPCCVDKKLPNAIIQAPHRALSFYTHGDVTMEKFYRAVSFLVADPHVMVVSMPVVFSETMAFLAQCFDRGWITDLVLSTQRPVGSLIERYLSGHRDHVLYVSSDDVTHAAAHMVLYSRRQALTIAGPMFSRANSVLSAYTMIYHPSYIFSSLDLDWGNPLRNVLFVDTMRHRKNLKMRKATHLCSTLLDRFIHMEFPPYKEDDE